jgi:predicted ATPase
VTNQARDTVVADGIENLIAKSLVTSDITGSAAFFRLLETTRAYALSRLAESGELPELSRRHAQYYLELLEQAKSEWEKRTIPVAHLDNIRAALEWSFCPTGDLVTGVHLAAAAAPVFLALSLFRECQLWSGCLAVERPFPGGRRIPRARQTLLPGKRGQHRATM